jgi:signal transduction histidine kinase
MMSASVVRVRIPPLLDIATYISLTVMSLLVARGLSNIYAQLMLFGLCAIYALLYHFVFRAGRYEKNPVLYFGSQLVVLILLLMLQVPFVDGINFMFLIVSIHAALVLTRKAALIWIAVYYVTVSVGAFLRSGSDAFFAAAFYLATYSVCGFFGYILQQAELERERNERLVEELKATQDKLQELAVLDERNRLARDLHDSVKQQVFAISMQLSAARTALSETDKAYPSVTEAEQLAQQAGTELTTLINALRPPALERKSLTDAVREYAKEWSRQNGMEITLSMDGDLPLSVNEEQVFFRVVQEALSNVARHSQATHVTLELIHEDSHVLFCIADNGKGFDAEHVQMGVGLHSMQERLTQIGATFHLQSEKDGGTQITAKLGRSQ